MLIFRVIVRDSLLYPVTENTVFFSCPDKIKFRPTMTLHQLTSCFRKSCLFQSTIGVYCDCFDFGFQTVLESHSFATSFYLIIFPGVTCLNQLLKQSARNVNEMPFIKQKQEILNFLHISLCNLSPLISERLPRQVLKILQCTHMYSTNVSRQCSQRLQCMQRVMKVQHCNALGAYGMDILKCEKNSHYQLSFPQSQHCWSSSLIIM